MKKAIHMPSQLLASAIQASTSAGNILKEGFGTTFSAAAKTGVHDLVTEFDKLAEDLIEARLRKAYPGHVFLGEEAGQIGQPHKGVVRWIIDPLDGTLNFCRSIPYFCVSVAAELDGRIICGVIYNPISGELFSAAKGCGAYLNGGRIYVSRVSLLQSAVLSYGLPFSTKGDPGHCLRHFANVASSGAQLLRMGSAALNMAYVAAGRFDGFMESASFPWDVAAGVILVEEAGGKVTNYDGAHYQIKRPGILATNGDIHKELLAVIKGSQ